MSPQTPVQAYDALTSPGVRPGDERTGSGRFKRRSCGVPRAGRRGACAQPTAPFQTTFPACAGARMWLKLVENARLGGDGGARNCDGWWQLVFGFGTRGDSPQMPSYPHLVRDSHGRGLGGEVCSRSGREREAWMPPGGLRREGNLEVV